MQGSKNAALPMIAASLLATEGQTVLRRVPPVKDVLVALQVLREQLAKGTKRIAIFYGAGHLADFSRRLVDDFGMKFTGEKWVEAWDLRAESMRLKRR